MLILGINAYHAEASAALLRDGLLIAAAEEERFARVKHIAGFPTHAVRYCLQEAGVRLKDVDAVAVSRNPWSHFLSKGWSAARRGIFSPAVRQRLGVLVSAGRLKKTLADALGVPFSCIRASVHYTEHHRAHIASSFYPSGWDSAVVLSLDGFGDFLSGMWGLGQGREIIVGGEVLFPHSLGIAYTAITQFLGFHQWGDEYKVMGLAAYGKPDRFRMAMQKILLEDSRRGYRLCMDYFRHHTAEGVSMTWGSGTPSLETLYSRKMEDLLGPAREPGQPLEDRHADIASALQERLETVILRLLQALGQRYKNSRLCYAGGVALNCVFNGKIRRNTSFQDVFIQPAAHDAGTSLGAALYTAHHLFKLPRRTVMTHAAWGPGVEEASCEQVLRQASIPYKRLDEPSLCTAAARALSDGRLVGWFQGRMEFGPRALGHRSLLADPRDPKMKDYINERVKRRESFRPFAPSVLSEEVPRIFPEGHQDPFMLFAYPVDAAYARKIPAVVHVDGTGRLQAVRPETEPLYWRLIKSFESVTQVPVILNTSFNEQEPIVCRPSEALACFQRNDIDCLALGPFWVDRKGGAL
ncbi:MAG: carbamoyltransferase [Candidatus Omnitrophica bacterium]|nr:carbamoyltransferase [Candidatus Omnitrophota bacterium]